jgi:hypothetical protein
MVRSVLLSILVRQQLSLKDNFRKRYPHAWLVWEQGAWDVSGAGEQNLGMTMPPVEDLQDCLPVGDLLAFELAVSEVPQTLKLGRSAQNDIIVNDSTVSREHLLLTCSSPESWTTEVSGPSQQLSISNKAIPYGTRAPVRQGDVLKVGEVLLTFYDAGSFEHRIRSEAEKLLSKLPRR